jgi:hypothetical protein
MSTSVLIVFSLEQSVAITDTWNEPAQPDKKSSGKGIEEDK